LRGVSKFSLDMFERFAEALEIDIFQIIDSYHKNVVLKKENPFWVPTRVAEPEASYANSNKLFKEKDNVIASRRDTKKPLLMRLLLFVGNRKRNGGIKKPRICGAEL